LSKKKSDVEGDGEHETKSSLEKKQNHDIRLKWCMRRLIGKNNSTGSKECLLNSNAVAVLIPYLRSELSLLTAQPNTECVVLPPFNVNKMLDNGNKTKKSKK